MTADGNLMSGRSAWLAAALVLGVAAALWVRPPTLALAPRPPGSAAAEPELLYGVRRQLLLRGMDETIAAKAAYVEDDEREAVLRRLDERTEAWENADVRYPHLQWGDRGRREVLLTFDDGPNPATTPRVLDILRRERVPAVFFVVGERAHRHPELVRRAAAEGHALGNHTWHHAYLTRMEPECARAQVEATGNAVRAITGHGTPWFRPPGGHYDPEVIRICRSLGLVTVLWSDQPGDWLRQGARRSEARALRFLKPGAIVLLHDTLPETVEMLPDFIRQVRARGFQFVPIDRFSRFVTGR